MDKQKIDFEKSLQRLETIVNKVEEETLPLEECLSLYEEAKKIISSLEKALKEAEEKIKELAND